MSFDSLNGMLTSLAEGEPVKQEEGALAEGKSRRGGLDVLENEIVGGDDGRGVSTFGVAMAEFCVDARDRYDRTVEKLAATKAQLRELHEFFEESFDEVNPTRCLVTLRRFVSEYDEAAGRIRRRRAEEQRRAATAERVRQSMAEAAGRRRSAPSVDASAAVERRETAWGKPSREEIQEQMHRVLNAKRGRASGGGPNSPASRQRRHTVAVVAPSRAAEAAIHGDAPQSGGGANTSPIPHQ